MIIHNRETCRTCIDDLAGRTAKRIADKMLIDMQVEFKSIVEHVGDDDGLFQGQVCHLIAAFVLCHSIKILQMKKTPEKLIDAICKNCVEMAFQFAKDGKFREVKDH